MCIRIRSFEKINDKVRYSKSSLSTAWILNLFGFDLSAHELADGGDGVEILKKDAVDGIGDGHFHVVLLGQLQDDSIPLADLQKNHARASIYLDRCDLLLSQVEQSVRQLDPNTMEERTLDTSNNE